MHLVIQKRNFLRSLARTHSVADRKSSMPILSNILLSTDGPKTLRLAATDLYLSVTSAASAEVKSNGTIALAARTLFDIVKSLPEGEISVQVVGNHAAEIRSGKVRFKIPGMPLRFSKYEVDENIQAPLLGEHNAEILQRFLKYPPAQVRDLRAIALGHVPDGLARLGLDLASVQREGDLGHGRAFSS